MPTKWPTIIAVAGLAAYLVYAPGTTLVTVFAENNPSWPQWGQNPQHTGSVPVAGQSPQYKFAAMQYDPFVVQEMAEEGALKTHYQVPLINGANIYMEFKTGTYHPCDPPGSGRPFPCGPDDWRSEIWNEGNWRVQNGRLVQVWSFATDWKPVPNSGSQPSRRALGGWEPTFQPALAGQYIYVPGAGGTIYKLNQADGSTVAQINPFGGNDPSKFVAGGLTADNNGNIYYNVLQVNVDSPWDVDVINSWLVRVAPDNRSIVVAYKALLPGAPTQCLGVFTQDQLPWPPSQNGQPGKTKCGSQRASLNVAPALSADGSTVYTVSRGHFWGRSSYLLAVNSSNLSLQWAASFQGLLNDGCNVLLPPDGQPGGCSIYGATGIDPTQNTKGAGIVSDQASASPVVTPDGSILFGVNTAYNYGRGHLLRFSPQGQFQTSYDFGWDTTPAVYANHGTYSVILKDNHYDSGSYCNDPTYCPKAKPGPYYITQLDSNLTIQWQYKDATRDQSHPNGYEWCVNAPAVDAQGTVYANSEDGNLYAVRQGGRSMQRVFMTRVLDAGYTPVSIGGDGTIYAENAGYLLVIGQIPTLRGPGAPIYAGAKVRQ